MAVGQVDILVGLPTLNNAATVVDVARAIHVCFTRDLPRARTVMINSGKAKVFKRKGFQGVKCLLDGRFAMLHSGQ